MPDFQKMRLSVVYDNYETMLTDPFEIYADFCRRRGYLPEEILWVRPGLMVAGPVCDEREAAPLMGEIARPL